MARSFGPWIGESRVRTMLKNILQYTMQQERKDPLARMSVEEAPPLKLPEVRKRLKPYVASEQKLSGTEALLRAASYRLITREEFEAIKSRAKGPGSKEMKATVWPDQADALPEKNKPKKRSRADVAARMAEAKGYECDTVTWTWDGLCKDPAKALPIEEALFAVNRITLEAYELANMHVQRLVREGTTTKLPLDQSFFYRCCTAVCVTNGVRNAVQGDEELEKTANMYAGWRSRDYKPVESKHRRPMLQVLSRDMATAAANMIKACFFRRFYMYVKKVIDCRAYYARKVCALVWGNRAKEPSKDPFVESLRRRMPGQYLTKENLHLFLPLLSTFQRQIEGKRHSLLPHKLGFTTSFLTINNGTLRALLQLDKQPRIPSEAKFLKDKDTWWNRLFNVRKMETKNRAFAYEVSTDGRSVKILMRKPAKKLVKVSLDVQTDASVRLALVVSMPKPDMTRPVTVRGVDPGWRMVYTAAGVRVIPGQESTWLPTLRCSSGEFYHSAMYRKSAAKVEKWVKASPEVEKVTSGMPTKHYTGMDGCRVRMQYIWPHLDMLQAFYGQRRVKNLKLQRHIALKRQLKAMCMKLTGGETDRANTIIGYGDAGRAVGIKARCGPFRRLRRELGKYATVLDIPEQYTSKTCSHCHCQAMHNMHNLAKRRKTGEVRQIKVHGVLHCSTSACKGKTWDRDINAALNILELTMTELRGWPRPGCFARQA